MLPAAGDVVDGKYEVIRLVGEGGMGSVFEAKHKVLGTPVALKFLDPELAKNPALVARFVQEARVSATVRSPHVVQVFDVTRTGEGGAHIVMEMLVGESLGDRLERLGRLDREQAMEIAIQVLAGLEVAHGLGVVHRDLKPDNVFVTESPGATVKILDFGIAKLKQSADFATVVTRPGSMMGTPSYMAPEQAIAAERVDTRADLYSVGVLLYEMLTGALPVDDDEPSAIIEKVMKRQTVPILARDPTTPAALAAIVDRALSPDPRGRPDTATSMRMELTALVRTLTPSGSHPGVPSSIGPAPSSALDARQSGVPRTLPPDEPGPPRSIVGGGMLRAGTGTLPPDSVVGTDSATALPERAIQRTLPDRPPRSATHRGVLWAAVLVLLASAGAVGAYLAGWLTPSPSPPPLPAPLTASSAAAELGATGPGGRLRSPAPRARPVPRSASPARGPVTPEPTSGAPAGVLLPTLQLPSVLPPMPAGFPTTLPTGLPGLPIAPAVGPSPAPASSGAPPPVPPARPE